MVSDIKKYMDSLFPKYSRWLLMLVFVYNCSVYYISRLIAGSKQHYDFSLQIEDNIPLLPWTIVIYWGAYVFWAVNYILCSRYSRGQAHRFLYADIIGKTICLLFYIFLPTTMTRPEITGHDIFSRMMQLLYNVDAADNLLPSIHCFVSWMCWIGMRKDERYDVRYRIFSLVCAIAICISTLTTKQHVLVDVFAGIILAEGCFFAMKVLTQHKEL